jgi:hypothetical protein
MGSIERDILSPIAGCRDKIQIVDDRQKDSIDLLKSISSQLTPLNEFSKKRHDELKPSFERHIHMIACIHSEMTGCLKHLKSIQAKLKRKNSVLYTQAEKLFPLPEDLYDS